VGHVVAHGKSQMFRYLKKKNLDQLANGLAAVLAVPFGKKIEKAVSKVIDDTKPSIYDDNIDQVYNQTHIAGGNHRLFDGSHSPLLMWEKVKETLPNDSRTEEVKNYFLSLLKDIQTTKGIPLTNISDKQSFDNTIQNLSSNFGINKDWFHDVLTINLAEFFSTTIAVLAFLFRWKERDKKEFTELSSNLLVYSTAAANPFLLVVSLISLGSSFTKNKKKSDFQKGFFRGIVGSGSFLLAAAMFKSPLLGLIFGICVLITIKKILNTINEEEIINWVKVRFKEHKKIIVAATAGVSIGLITGS